MISSVRLLASTGADREPLTAFYTAHGQDHIRHRVAGGSLSLDPRCLHMGTFDPDGALLAVKQMLPARLLGESDHWPTFFESHTIPGDPALQMFLLQPVARRDAAGRQALGDLCEEIAARAVKDELKVLILGAPGNQVETFERLGFSVYANGRRSAGMGFAVPMVRLLSSGSGMPPSEAARAWLAGAQARRARFITRDLGAREHGRGVFGRLKDSF